MADITQEQLDRLLTAAEVAELFDVSVSIVRRETRKNRMPGVVKFMKYTGYDSELIKSWTPPDGTARETREDGRKKFVVMLNDEEAVQLKELGIEIIDTRAQARARRDARKAKKGAEAAEATEATTEEADELFDNFGA